MANGKCSICEIVLTEENCTATVFRRGGYCRSCDNSYRNQRHSRLSQEERKQYNERCARTTFLYKYGITLEEFQIKLKNQNDRCEICNDVMVKPQQDHSHKTGKVRDLLCRSCNVLLGFAREDIKILVSAAKYLQKHKSDSSTQIVSCG